MKKYERTFLLVMALLGFGFASISSFHNLKVNEESSRIAAETNNYIVEHNKLVEEYNGLLEETINVNETNLYLIGLIENLEIELENANKR